MTHSFCVRFLLEINLFAFYRSLLTPLCAAWACAVETPYPWLFASLIALVLSHLGGRWPIRSTEDFSHSIFWLLFCMFGVETDQNVVTLRDKAG